MKEIKAGLYLCKTPGKNWGLHLIYSTRRNYLALKRVVLRGWFNSNLNPFIQSDSDPMREFWKQLEDENNNIAFRHDYLFIEFWTNNQELILEESLRFAESIEEELLLEDF